MCNALRLDDMHASLPDVKYRPPPLMIHRHRVPLFAFQSLLCSFDVLAYLRASLPLKCKCSAHPRLSTMITALAVYQAWQCPQVWCCLIHHEGFYLLWIFLRIILWLIVCIMPTPIKIVNPSWTCLQLKQYFSSIYYHQPSWNCQVIQTWISYLAVKGSSL